MVGTRDPAAGRRVLLALLVVAVGLAPATTATAATDEAPRFEVNVPKPTLSPGTTQQLTVELTNDAADVDDRVETASAVEAEVTAGGTPLTVESGPRLLDAMPDGVTRTVTVRLTVPDDVPGGTYRLPVRLTYEFDGDERERQTVYATVRVDPRARLHVVDTARTVAVGERGSLSVTVANRGTRAARDVRLTLTSPNDELRVGDAASSTLRVGTLEAGERRTVTYPVRATDAAERTPYALAATTTYEDHDGRTQTDELEPVGVTPAPALAVYVRNVSSTLRVGERGTLTGTVVNRGPRTAHDAVVVVGTDSPLLGLPETRYPVGDLDAGAGATFDYRIEVPETADAGPRRFSVALAYETADGDPARTDAVQVRRRVAPERDRFRLAPVNATLEADTSNRVVVRITNVGDEPLSDVSAVVAPRPPFTTESEAAYVPRLAPGESARLAFELTVSEDAVPSRSAVAVDVTAEEPDGDPVRTGPHLVPVTVVDRGGLTTDLAILLGGVVVLLLLGVGALWTRR
jgi:hypothetical protein